MPAGELDTARSSEAALLYAPCNSADAPYFDSVSRLDLERGVRQRSGIAVLDAQRIEDGPIAEAGIEDGFPLGFHGGFVPARG